MKKLNRYILFLLSIAALSSCNLDTEPQTEVDAGNKERIADEDYVNGLYSLMTDDVSYYGRNFVLWGDIGTDLIVQYRNSGRFVENYRLEKESTVGESDIYERNTYDKMYQVISNANLMLDDENLTGDARGQAFFIRGFVHLDLVRAYGEVPYVTTAPKTVEEALNFKPSNDTRQVLYEGVLADLDSATNLITNTDIKWATQNAVYATLSRALLYYAEYQEDNGISTDETFQRVIAVSDMVAGRSLTPAEGYADYFRKNGGEETILEFLVTSDQGKGSNDFGNIYLAPYVGGYGDYSVNPDFVTSMFREQDGEAFSDVRGIVNFDGEKSPSVLFREHTDSGEEIIFNHKFFKSENTMGLYSPKVLRYAEVLLNKAEALAKLGRNAEAAAIINQIHENRYVSPVRGATEGDAEYQARVDAYNTALTSATGSLAEVLEERKIEFAFEGHRFFDLRRNGLTTTSYALSYDTNADGDREYVGTTVLGEAAPNDTSKGGDQQWFPIPDRELRANENMKQNNGY